MGLLVRRALLLPKKGKRGVTYDTHWVPLARLTRNCAECQCEAAGVRKRMNNPAQTLIRMYMHKHIKHMVETG